jgi:hypothetical protein
MGGEKRGEKRVSCNRGSVQTGQAATAVGVPGGSSKLGYTTGVLLNTATQTLDRVGQATAPAVEMALRVIEPTGPQASRQRAVAGRLLGSAVAVGARLAGVAPVLAKVKLAAAVSDLVTSQVGMAIGAFSETEKAGEVVTEQRRFFFFKSKQPVALQRSNLTRWLNRQEMVGPRSISVSNGALFTVGGKTWHRGTVKFEVGSKQQTITHLQSLSYPAEHYYFDRNLSNRQAVTLATGQVKPETMPGFVGQISKGENLCTVWAGSKRALILARLHWGTGKKNG